MSGQTDPQGKPAQDATATSEPPPTDKNANPSASKAPLVTATGAPFDPTDLGTPDATTPGADAAEPATPAKPSSTG